MDEALKTWRNLHGINEEAYKQLRVLLFRQPLEITHFVASSHTNPPPTLNGISIFSSDPFETRIQNRRLFNTDLSPGLLKAGMPNEGF